MRRRGDSNPRVLSDARFPSVWNEPLSDSSNAITIGYYNLCTLGHALFEEGIELLQILLCLLILLFLYTLIGQ